MDAAPKAKMQCCGNYEVFTWVPWISGLHVPQTPLFYIWLAHCGHTWDSRLFWGTQACYWGLWWSILDTCFAEHSHPPVTGIYNIMNTNKLELKVELEGVVAHKVQSGLRSRMMKVGGYQVINLCLISWVATTQHLMKQNLFQ
jgi:hypothetical protein